jgi:hypothetical protein
MPKNKKVEIHSFTVAVIQTVTSIDLAIHKFNENKLPNLCWPNHEGEIDFYTLPNIEEDDNSTLDYTYRTVIIKTTRFGYGKALSPSLLIKAKLYKENVSGVTRWYVEEATLYLSKVSQNQKNNIKPINFEVLARGQLTLQRVFRGEKDDRLERLYQLLEHIGFHKN